MPSHIDRDDYDSCPQFNDWLDEQYADQHEALDLFGFQPRPSYVLHQLNFSTYEAALADFLSDREEQLKQTVHYDFPAPIAHYYYRFEYGFENELQRLLFLRDTWEAIIDVLHALAVGECRFRQLMLQDPIKFKHFLSDSVAQRLLNIERVIDHAAGQGMNLAISGIVTIPVLNTMRELNRSRNAFSHSAAQSETQARVWISECYQDVLNILEELRGLADVSVVRYLGQEDGKTLRCEFFRGHALTRTIRTLPLTDDQVQASQRYFYQGEILVSVQDCVFSLRPLIYFREDPSGHTTKLCMFRKTKGNAPDRRLEYEVVGEATRRDEDRTHFKLELDELRSLFSLGPD
jgi:hypothetical protein